MRPFFSIIIPTLNEEHYLPLLLLDLSKQREMNFEVVIADASSEDRTRVSAMKFKKYFALSFYQNERKNVAYQRNFGAKRAKGKYLVFLDADGRISPLFTKILKKYIERNKGLVFVPYNLPSEKDSQTLLTYRLINFLIEFSLNTARPFTNMGMIWDSAFFTTINGFDESIYLAEDHEIIQRVQKWGVKAKFVRNIRVTYSLRRMKREGRWQLLYKYVLATAHILLKGDIKKEIFKYEMGGIIKAKSIGGLAYEVKFKAYIEQLKKFFKNNLISK